MGHQSPVERTPGGSAIHTGRPLGLPMAAKAIADPWESAEAGEATSAASVPPA